jgi:diadenosine tetraphosphate (Ap4A) HIT family hydrolase
LLIPKRHTGSFFDLSEQERSDLLSLLDRAKLALDEEFQPQGYNIGINDGAAAGQTVPHLHVHLIPRFDGDCPIPGWGAVGHTGQGEILAMTRNEVIAAFNAIRVWTKR